MRRPHLRENFIEPLQRPVQVHLDPTRSARHVLSVVLRTPALHEAHPNRAHLGQFIDGFEPVIDALRQQLCELGVVEDAQRAAGRYFAHGGGVEAVVVVAVAGLYENGAIRKAFCVNFAVDVVEVDALAYVTPCVFDGRVAVHVAQLAQAETVAVVAGVCETVHDDGS